MTRNLTTGRKRIGGASFRGWKRVPRVPLDALVTQRPRAVAKIPAAGACHGDGDATLLHDTSTQHVCRLGLEPATRQRRGDGFTAAVDL